MTWMIEFLTVLVLTSLTGSLILVVWFGLGMLLDRAGYRNIFYWFLQMAGIFFAVPVVYLVFQMTDVSRMLAGGVLFAPTPMLLGIGYTGVALWLCVLGVMAGRMVWRGRCFRQLLQDAFPCEEKVDVFFRKACVKQRVPEGSVRLLQSYHVQGPVIVGTLHPTVILPVQVYREEELSVIFDHELTHYRHRDLWLRFWVRWILVFHWWNPVVWWYSRLIRRWGEYACDYAVCVQRGGMKEYFTVIQNLVAAPGAWELYFGVQLREDEHELLRRVKRMKAYRKKPVRSKVQAAVICLLLLGASSVSVYAGTLEAAEGYQALFEATQVEVREASAQAAETVEYTETELRPGITVQEERAWQTRSISTFQWEVGAGIQRRTGGFRAEAGDTINVMVVLGLSDLRVKVGIVEPDGIYRYVLENGSVHHTFFLSKTGTYRVYVENDNSTAVTAEGSYIY